MVRLQLKVGEVRREHLREEVVATAAAAGGRPAWAIVRELLVEQDDLALLRDDRLRRLACECRKVDLDLSPTTSRRART